MMNTDRMALLWSVNPKGNYFDEHHLVGQCPQVKQSIPADPLDESSKVMAGEIYGPENLPYRQEKQM